MSTHRLTMKDIKPSISRTSSPDMISSGNEGEYLPSPSPTSRKSSNLKSRKRSPSSTPSPTVKSKKPKGGPAGIKHDEESKNRKTGNWTKSEVRQLWDAMGFLPVKVRWDDVAQKVDGRDKLSCSNKWRYDMLPKVQAFIDSLGD
ncbi:uncharacterized protein IL334_000610 [Kwoniella shivajii]|uniref:Myb-like domain-containing protein n=1 Tax=Kwoniella shivajii TaxID=564305 RepID=A0ABZ1CTU8_9TREE|nr:hypothetical protein IL334_000610 [Kwoniella shivajii]